MDPLIAAAPELLEALLRTRNLAANLEARNPVSPETLHAVWEAGDRAIAKARGEVATTMENKLLECEPNQNPGDR